MLNFPGCLLIHRVIKFNCLTEMLSEEFKETDNVFNCLALGRGISETSQAFPGAQAASSVSEMATYIYGYAL